MSLRGPNKAARVTRSLLMLVVAIIFAMPLVWMAATSIKPESQAMSQGLSLLPDPVTSAPSQAAANYEAVLEDPTVDFPLYMRNTIVVVALGVFGCIISSVVVAYGLARVPMPGRKPLIVITIGTMLIPFPVLMAPLFMLYAKLGWIGTFLPLYAQFWLGNAFSIDGCSH